MKTAKMTKIKNLIQVDKIGKEVIIRGIPTYSDGIENYVQVPIIAIKDFEDGVIKLDPNQKRTIKNSMFHEKSKLKEGDVLIATRGSAFKAAIVHSEATKYVPSQNIIGLRLNNTILPEVLVAYLNSDYGQHAINEVAKVGTISSISIQDLKEISIPLLPLKVQTTIKNMILSMQQYKILTQREQEIIEKMNDSIVFNFLEAI